MLDNHLNDIEVRANTMTRICLPLLDLFIEHVTLNIVTNLTDESLESMMMHYNGLNEVLV